MHKTTGSFGTILVALAFMAFGVQHFVFQIFVTGRPPAWPQGLPGEQAVVFISGTLLFASGLVILMRKGWQFPFGAGVIVLLWSGVRNAYDMIAHLDYGAVLTSTNKALTISGAALAMAAIINSKSEHKFLQLNKAITIEKYFVGIFLFTAGIQHFIYADFVKFLVPVWIPAPLFWAYFAGVALIAAGLGIITGIRGQLAAALSGWMVFAWLLMLHIPRALEFNNANEWTAVAEATLVSGILFVIASRKAN